MMRRLTLSLLSVLFVAPSDAWALQQAGLCGAGAPGSASGVPDISECAFPQDPWQDCEEDPWQLSEPAWGPSAFAASLVDPWQDSADPWQPFAGFESAAADEPEMQEDPWQGASVVQTADPWQPSLAVTHSVPGARPWEDPWQPDVRDPWQDDLDDPWQ